jgi:hypothetical protein
MDTIEARKIVDAIPESDRTTLSDAHLRYMHFTGVYTGDISDDVIAQDRATFPQLLRWDEKGRPSLSDQRSNPNDIPTDQ